MTGGGIDRARIDVRRRVFVHTLRQEKIDG